MEPEVELSRRETTLVRGTLSSKTGTAVLTTSRLLFYDEVIAQAGGGILEDVVASAVQGRHERGGPLVDLPLASITRVGRETKLFAKNRIRISADGDEYLFNDGWKEWSALLRETLSARHGRRVVDEAADTWRIEPT